MTARHGLHFFPFSKLVYHNARLQSTASIACRESVLDATALPLHKESTIQQANNASAHLPRAQRAPASPSTAEHTTTSSQTNSPQEPVILQADGALAPLPRAARASLSEEGGAEGSVEFFRPGVTGDAPFTLHASGESKRRALDSPRACHAVAAAKRGARL